METGKISEEAQKQAWNPEAALAQIEKKRDDVRKNRDKIMNRYDTAAAPSTGTPISVKPTNEKKKSNFWKYAACTVGGLAIFAAGTISGWKSKENQQYLEQKANMITMRVNKTVDALCNKEEENNPYASKMEQFSMYLQDARSKMSSEHYEKFCSELETAISTIIMKYQSMENGADSKNKDSAKNIGKDVEDSTY